MHDGWRPQSPVYTLQESLSLTQLKLFVSLLCVITLHNWIYLQQIFLSELGIQDGST